MSKRSKHSSQTEIYLNGERIGEFPLSSKKRLTPSKTVTNRIETTHPIPLPFLEEDSTYVFDKKPILPKGESINIGAEDLFKFTKEQPTIPDEPSTSSSYIFPSMLLGTRENISNILTDTESVSSSETSDDELASDSSSCQSTGIGFGGGPSKKKRRKMTRSEYYKERLIQIDRAQKDRRERWRNKLQNMQMLLSIIKS